MPGGPPAGATRLRNTVRPIDELLQAAESGDVNQMARLLDRWFCEIIDVDDVSSGLSPLMKASYGGHVRAVHLLLSRGAAINRANGSGITALMCACSGGHLSTVKLLLCNGANHRLVSKDGNTALHYACYGGNLSVVEILLRLGACYTCNNKSGQSAIMFWRDNANKAQMQALIDSLRGMPRLDAIERDSNLRVYSVTSLVLAAGVGDVNELTLLLNKRRWFGLLGKSIDINGYHEDLNALMVACINGHETAVRLLISRGADVNLIRQRRMTALMYACEKGHLSIVEILVRRKANRIFHSMDGNTALHFACIAGHLPVVEFLLSDGVSHTCQNNNRDTPLHCACRYGHLPVFEFLLGQGASHTCQNNERRTPIETCKPHERARFEAMVRSMDPENFYVLK